MFKSKMIISGVYSYTTQESLNGTNITNLVASLDLPSRSRAMHYIDNWLNYSSK